MCLGASGLLACGSCACLVLVAQLLLLGSHFFVLETKQLPGCLHRTRTHLDLNLGAAGLHKGVRLFVFLEHDRHLAQIVWIASQPHASVVELRSLTDDFGAPLADPGALERRNDDKGCEGDALGLVGA